MTKTRLAPQHRFRHSEAAGSDRRKRRPRSNLSARKPFAKAKRKFLKAFPDGFRDETYIDGERAYKWNAHLAWTKQLSKSHFEHLLARGEFQEIASIAVRIESKTNLLFSFEKMALRDAVKSASGAEAFANALYLLLHGPGNLENRFSSWIESIAELPRRQTRVLTWPLVTVFGFLAQPDKHFFLKPTVTREAARRCGYDLPYQTRPSWFVYEGLLKFADQVRRDLRDLRHGT